MHYVKTKREKVGICNICSTIKSLTWDHVPPKGGIKLSTMQMENLMHVFTANEDRSYIRESQNGIKFRTICKECNEFLGQKYDHVVNEFAISVGRYLNSNLEFPKLISHKTKPVRLMKGILGHLLAAKLEYDHVLLDTKVREFILDEYSTIPEEIFIFYWIYPYNRTVILRDFAMPAVRGNFSEFGFYHTLKYFPIAYLISNKNHYENLMELTRFRECGVDEEIEIPIELNDVKHCYWPEMIDEGNLLSGGKSIVSSITAVPKAK